MKSYIMKLHVIGPDARAFETEMKLRNPGLFTQMTQENLDMQERHLITPEASSASETDENPLFSGGHGQ